MASKSIKKWLADNAGATILMALLALLVVSMVAATILAAANSTVRQAKADQEFEQNSLSLQSAANFIAEDLRSDKGFKVVASREIIETLDDDGIYSRQEGEWKVKASGKSYFSEQLVEAVEQVYCFGGDGTGSFDGHQRPFEITAVFKNTENDVDATVAVRASFAMKRVGATNNAQNSDDTDSLTFELQPDVRDEDGTRLIVSEENAHTMYVKFETLVGSSSYSKPEPEDGKVRTSMETRVYTWNVSGFSTSE